MKNVRRPHQVRPGKWQPKDPPNTLSAHERGRTDRTIRIGAGLPDLRLATQLSLEWDRASLHGRGCAGPARVHSHRAHTGSPAGGAPVGAVADRALREFVGGNDGQPGSAASPGRAEGAFYERMAGR